MMSALWGAKTASIHKVGREIAERPKWNVDRQTNGQTAFQLYIYTSITKNWEFSIRVGTVVH